MVRKHCAGAALLAAGAVLTFAQIKPPKPGFNIFSRDQDVQLGKEAAAQVEKQYKVVDNAELNGYVRRIGQRLVKSAHASDFPYTFKVVADDSINAFALPGGPMFIHTGLILAADNEAQLAGVMAHEMSHVALRHGTNQASKANLLQLPAVLAGQAVGDSVLGALTKAGVGIGANSVLMKFSRTAEAQADYNGTLIMADAGYNPVEMSRFFEKLEAESKKPDRVTQWFSSHPNPGDRVRNVEALVRQLPARNYTAEQAELRRMQAIVARIPVPKRAPAAARQSG